MIKIMFCKIIIQIFVHKFFKNKIMRFTLVNFVYSLCPSFQKRLIFEYQLLVNFGKYVGKVEGKVQTYKNKKRPH